MATNLAIDEKLLAEAQEIAGLKTKKATVNEALREFIQRRKQLEALGQIDFDPKYNHKQGRTRRWECWSTPRSGRSPSVVAGRALPSKRSSTSSWSWDGSSG